MVGNPSSSFGQDKRRHRRYKGVIVEYAVFKYAKGNDAVNFKPALIRDVSLSGLSIFVDDTIETGEQLALRLYSSQSNIPIMAIGKVIWARQSQELPRRDKDHYNLGIEIVDIDNKNKMQLTKMISLFDMLERKEEDGTTTI